MTFDPTINLGNVITAVGFALGGWRIGVSFRDEIRGLRQTVYGSIEPPVEGLVKIAERHERTLGTLSPLPRHEGRR